MSAGMDYAPPRVVAPSQSPAVELGPNEFATRRLMQWWTRTTGAQLGTVLALAALVRLVGLNRVGLNSDEAVYAAQSASLAGNPHFDKLFPIVRAHPLLMQVLMSPLYRAGVPDVAGRYIAALFGVATVGLVFVLGRIMYDARVAVLAAALLAVMPYHVVLSRQIMLDGPMTFFSTAALTCLALAASRPHRTRWLVATGAMLGLAALSKEIAIIMVGCVFVFLSLENKMLRPFRFPLVGALVAVFLAMSYPLLTALAGGSHSGQSYLLWQLTRQPNHTFWFYAVVVGGSVGFAAIAAGLIGLVLRRWNGRSWTWRETMLSAWVGVPLIFFEIWPVKGFSYLLPLAPVVAILAARGIIPTAELLRTHARRMIAVVAAAVVALSLAVPSALAVIGTDTSGLAGSGGLPGGRETGRWVAEHTPRGATFLTIGPTMANLIQYYSGRRADALSVSPNPLHRNPTYRPVVNADAALRGGTYQYIVWDVYSANRSATFSGRCMDLVHRFHGSLIHTETGNWHGHSGRQIIKVYEVTP